MRIIDKNVDFYDYLQNIYKDNTLTFDRTDSFELTKELMCQFIRYSHRYSKYVFVLLQVCNSFWLFLLEVTKEDKTYDLPQEYTIELLATWKNYDKPRKLIQVDTIRFDWEVLHRFAHFNAKIMRTEYDKQSFFINTPVLVEAVDRNNYKVEDSANKHIIYNGDGTSFEKHIPILKSCGMATWIDPLAIYLSIEEYFSLEKQSTERDHSVGITDNEKIENHGFDTVSSFRGKQKKNGG